MPWDAVSLSAKQASRSHATQTLQTVNLTWLKPHHTDSTMALFQQSSNPISQPTLCGLNFLIPQKYKQNLACGNWCSTRPENLCFPHECQHRASEEPVGERVAYGRYSYNVGWWSVSFISGMDPCAFFGYLTRTCFPKQHPNIFPTAILFISPLEQTSLGCIASVRLISIN